MQDLLLVNNLRVQQLAVLIPQGLPM